MNKDCTGNRAWTAKQLFLLDSLGALVSALVLGLALPSLEHVLGMPTNVLYFLSLIAALFCIHSFFRFLENSANSSKGMKIVAWSNLTYVIITIALVIYYYPEITFMGMLYFALESLVILVLVRLELQNAKPQTTKKKYESYYKK